MGLFDSDAKLDKRVADQYPGKWDMLEIFSENAHGQENSYNCAKEIAKAADLVDFPIIVGVREATRVSTDGTMWGILIRVGWPSGQVTFPNMTNVMDSAHIRDFDLGRFNVGQDTKGDYSSVLSSATLNMKKMWRLNYRKGARR
jgi:hypothetical protein